MAGGFRSDSVCLARLVILGVGCTLASPVLAGDWQRSVSVPVTYETDSNPTLAAQGSETLRRMKVAPSFKLTGSFDVDDLWANASLLVERSSNRSVSLPRRDPGLQVGWRHLLAAGEYGLVANYREASTRVAELEETGLITRDGTRRTRSIGANWRMATSERGTAAATADYSSVDDDGATGAGSRNTSVNLSYTYALSDRFEPFLRVMASHYVPANAGVTSDNTSVTAGAQIKGSDNLEWTVQGGPSRVSAAASATRWQGSLALRHAGIRHAATLEVGRSVSATGTSGFVESDRLRGSFTYTVGEHTHTGLDVSRARTKGLAANTMDQLSIWASHDLSQYWNARVNIIHKQRRQAGLDAASADMVGLTLIYSHLGF